MERLLATDPDALDRATAVLDEARLAVLPTDTLYALASDALDEDAVLEVFRVKRRAADLALPVCVGGYSDLLHVAHGNALARALADAFWPGAVTLVLKAKPWLPDALTARGDTVAVRAPAHPFALALARRFGPFTVTSANRSGEPPAARVEDAEKSLAGDVALFVDGGALAGVASTIVDCTGERATIIREGAVPAAKVLSVGT
jgi:L-threonylcarbamoyladenylate synthase